MSEPVFLRHSHGLTLDEIAALTGATLPAAAARALRIVNVAPLDTAGPSDLTFFDKGRFKALAEVTHAGACLTTTALACGLPATVVSLIVPQPYLAFVMVVREMFPQSVRPSSLYEASGIASAHVHPEARLENGVTVDPGAVIGPRVEIGSGTVVGSNAVIGADVRIGRDCSVGASAVISHALIGDRVIIHEGAKIGKDGFGYVMREKRHLKVPQVGRVIIQDDVEIGASSTIDRGAIRDTVIGEGTKIDNLVQIGHNVQIGRCCILAGQSGISGSVTIGDYAMLGGAVGVSDHLNIGEGAMLAGGSKVWSDVPAGQRWGGFPAGPLYEWIRAQVALRRLGHHITDAKSERPMADDGGRE